MNFEQFLEKYQKVPVEEYPNQVPENPVVSVCVQTYQHAPFIRECLDSILMQKTDFPFEILLGDDDSTDGTREICIEYADKYPDKIRLFLHHRENNIEILGTPTGRFNSLYNFFSANGAYIAICEGDDYWVDYLKLQKQVEILDKHTQYGLVHGNADIYFQNQGVWKRNANKNLSNNTLIKDKKELFIALANAEYQIRTASVLFSRKLLNNKLSNKTKFLMLDTALWLDFSQDTQFKYINEIWTVYRVNKGSASKPKSKLKRIRFILSSLEMRIYYHKLYNYELNDVIISKYNEAMINYKLHRHHFKPKYELINPTNLQRLKYKYSRYYLTRIMNYLELAIKHHIKSIMDKFTK